MLKDLGEVFRAAGSHTHLQFFSTLKVARYFQMIH